MKESGRGVEWVCRSCSRYLLTESMNTYLPTNLLTHLPAYIHKCWQTHPQRPDDWCSPASHLWTAFSGMCPAGSTLPGWSWSLHLQTSLIPKHGYCGSDRAAPTNVQSRRVDMAALRGGVEKLGVQKDQTEFGVPISSFSVLSWHLLFNTSQRYTQSELIKLYYKGISHEVWCNKKNLEIFPKKLVIVSSDMWLKAAFE